MDRDEHESLDESDREEDDSDVDGISIIDLDVSRLSASGWGLGISAGFIVAASLVACLNWLPAGWQQNVAIRLMGSAGLFGVILGWIWLGRTVLARLECPILRPRPQKQEDAE